ncbi:MAG: [protein-PII] uridylyltransferase [Verrucomicrobia bacterium]|nr:[protein-PII] uridylyltransferase [Verrucomicrobiota bacterium]
MPPIESPSLNRLHQHAQKRLAFDPGVPRSEQLPAYKRFLELENEMLARDHRKGLSGRKICLARTAMVDVAIENLFLAALNRYTKEKGRLPCKMAVLATGGYGRAELNPHSDIDIMFLYPDRISNKERFDDFQAILTEEILYPLWDFGWKVGHASRNSREVLTEARAEIQSKNAILESRFICGSEPLYEKMWSRFMKYVRTENPRDYIKQRLIAEKARHGKSGHTVYLQEPDVKNGVGGLRDYQNILWMAHVKFGYENFKEIQKVRLLRQDERVAMERAYDFLLRVRNELHMQNKRPTDKLQLEQQPQIAEGLNYSQEDIFERVEAFMMDYYSAARTIYHTSELLKERLALSTGGGHGESPRFSFGDALRAYQKGVQKKVDGFVLRNRVFSAGSKKIFSESPVRLIRIFRYLQQFGAEMDSELKFLVSRSIPLIDGSLIQSRSAAKSFCSILRSAGEVYPILKEMHNLGVLGRYLPEFGQLTCRVQHEYYHRYTADEHVLRTIKYLDRVFQKVDEVSANYERALRQNDDPLLLYLILLLHDIGKAEGVKGHDTAGARIARPILDRFEIDPQQQEVILFIIRNHLEMARIWQRFDLDDPKTASAFAEKMEDPQKLRYLFVHTYCDARGTAPTLWNGYKDTMHRQLFRGTLEAFEGQDVIERKRKERIAMLHEEILSHLPEGLSVEEMQAHFSLLPERYFINPQAEEIALHMRMTHELMDQIQNTESVGSLMPVIDWRDDPDLNLTVVNVVTWDRAGLFYKLAGALTLAGVNILSTKAVTRKDHISIDTFYIMDTGGGLVSDSRALKIFRQHLHDSLVEGKRLQDAIELKETEVRKAEIRKNRDLLPAPFPPRVDVYHELSLKRTIIEVQATDRLALLYRLARLIHSKGFDITFARIATERGVAMDTFYIENRAAAGQVDSDNLLELRSELEAIIETESAG